MKKWMLLGAGGQLGREWQQLVDDEIDLKPYGSTQLDITHLDEVKKEIFAQQPSVIINCAAYTKVDKAEDQRKKAHVINAKAVKNLARLCQRKDIKLVHFSTDYVVAGEVKDQQYFPDGYPETHTTDPVNWYGQTKWEGEQAIRKSNCRHLIIRVSWLCGASGNNFVKTMLRLAENHKQLKVVDDQYGSPAFTHNVVQNTRKLIEEDRQGTYHLTSDGLISWADFAEAIFRIAGKGVKVNKVPSEEYPTRAPRPRFSKLNTEKLSKVDGSHIIQWKQGLRQLLEQLA